MAGPTEEFSITQLLNHPITKGAVVVLCLLMLSAIASACPTCKEALFDPEQVVQTVQRARGYALSIGLLLFVPFGLVGGLGALIVQSARHCSKRKKCLALVPGTCVDTARCSR